MYFRQMKLLDACTASIYAHVAARLFVVVHKYLGMMAAAGLAVSCVAALPIVLKKTSFLPQAAEAEAKEVQRKQQ